MVRGIHPILPLLAAVGLAMLGACGGGSSNQISSSLAPFNELPDVTPITIVDEPASGMLPSFGSPDTLHTTSVVDGLWARGTDMEEGLPYQNIGSGNTDGGLLFSPNWDGVENRESAFALWAFDTSAYNPGGRLNFEWVEPIHDFSNVWIGISDYPRQGWSWSNGVEPPDPVEFDLDTAISESGVVFVAVVILGTDQCELSGIGISETGPPDIAGASPTFGGTNQGATFSAQNVGVAVETWEWDFGGAATPGTSTDESPVVTLGEPGIYECSVRGTNGLGSSSYDFSFEITRWNYGVIFHSTRAFDLALSDAGIPHITIGDGKYLNWNGDIWDYEDFGDSFTTSIELDEGGNPHLAYLENGTNEFKYAYQDAGEWAFELIDPDPSAGIRSALALDQSGNPECAYLYFGGPYELRYARRVGSNWETETIKDIPYLSSCTSLAIDSSGNPHFLFLKWWGDGDLSALQYIHWDNGEWVEYILDAGVAGWYHSELVLDQDDNPHIVFFSGSGASSLLNYAYWNQVEWNVDQLTDTHTNHASIDLDSQGNPWISYPQDLDLNLVHHDGSNWQYEKVDDLEEYNLGWTQIELDSSDNPHIAYYGDNTDNLPESTYEIRYAYIGDEIKFPPYVLSLNQVPEHHNYTVQFKPNYVCKPDTYYWDFGGAATPNTSTEQAPTVIFGEAGTYNGSLIVANGDGEDTYDFELELDQWTFETVDNTPATWFRSGSIALDAQGFSHLSYHDFTNKDLWYAYWDGAAWQHELVDETGDTGSASSLALDSFGNPHIAYFDSTAYVINYAWKDEEGWHYEELIEGSKHVALTLDEANHPHICFSGRLESESGLVYAFWNGFGWEYSLVDDTTGGVSIALDSLEHPRVTYMNGWKLRYASWDGATWQFEELNSQAGYNVPSLQIDLLDRAHLAYVTREGELIYTYWDGSDWQSDVADTRSVRSEASMTLDSLYRPHVIYTSGSEFSYSYWDGVNWEKTILTTSADNPICALALDENDIPHVSFPQNNALMHAYNPAP